MQWVGRGGGGCLKIGMLSTHVIEVPWVFYGPIYTIQYHIVQQIHIFIVTCMHNVTYVKNKSVTIA